MHRFDESLRRGEFHAQYLDFYFGPEFVIREATRSEDRRGIDRWFAHRLTGEMYAIQYKADERASETGNAFVEVVSVDVDNVDGWAYTTEADFILYYLPCDGKIYVIRPRDVMRFAKEWRGQYPIRQAKNDGYSTHGICVPLAVFGKCALKIIAVPHVYHPNWEDGA